MVKNKLENHMLFGTGKQDLNNIIDLRSDVVTKPTNEMLNFMMAAEVGNDGWKEDPTVNELENKIANMLGKEAAILVPSGSMANEIAIALIASPGSEVIVDRFSHIFNYEACGPSALSGISLRK